MTVADLITLLQQYPPHLRVAYQLFSEQCLMQPEDISVATLCVARPDGWIQNHRTDMQTEQYVLLPGN